MPSTKRDRPSEQTVPRKSARIAQPPLRLGFEADRFRKRSQSPPPKQIGVQHTINLDGIGEAIDRFNRIRQFAPCGYGRKAADYWVDEIAKRVDDVERIIDRAQEEINDACCRIRWQTSSFADSASQRRHWYEQGDLTDLDVEQIPLRLDSYSIRDPAHYARYLRRVLLEACAKEAEWDPEGTYKRDLEDIRPKLLPLVKVMHRIPNGLYHAFHLYIFVLANVLRDNKKTHDRLLYKDLTTIHNGASAAILELLKDRPTDKKDADGQPYPTYWNCAAASRHLRLAMSEVYCEMTDRYGDRWKPYMDEREHKAAHKEIRQKILLIAGKRLPAELTDHIFREALLAEDIPEQPEVKEWKDFPVEQQRRKCVKEIYRCGKMSWYD